MYHIMKMMECGNFYVEKHMKQNEAKLVSLKSVFDLDNSVGILKDMPCGYYAERKAQDDEWSVRKTVTISSVNSSLQKYLANFPYFTGFPAHSLVK